MKSLFFKNEPNYNRQEQLQATRVNTQLLNEREQEINNIVKSIHDLNELFKDLATMVVDQVSIFFIFYVIRLFFTQVR